MTRHEIDTVLDRVRTSPEKRQEDTVAMLLLLEGEQSLDVYVLDEREERALDEAEAASDRGEFATDEEITALLNRHRV